MVFVLPHSIYLLVYCYVDQVSSLCPIQTANEEKTNRKLPSFIDRDNEKHKDLTGQLSACFVLNNVIESQIYLASEAVAIIFKSAHQGHLIHYQRNIQDTSFFLLVFLSGFQGC